jgi:hypothetical protein
MGVGSPSRQSQVEQTSDEKAELELPADVLAEVNEVAAVVIVKVG